MLSSNPEIREEIEKNRIFSLIGKQRVRAFVADVSLEHSKSPRAMPYIKLKMQICEGMDIGRVIFAIVAYIEIARQFKLPEHESNLYQCLGRQFIIDIDHVDMAGRLYASARLREMLGNYYG